MLLVCAGGSSSCGSGIPSARDRGVGGGVGSVVTRSGGSPASLLSDGSRRRAGWGWRTWRCFEVGTRITYNTIDSTDSPK